MFFRGITMRRKKSVLYILLGVTILSLGLYVTSNYSNSNQGVHILKVAGNSGGSNVQEMGISRNDKVVLTNKGDHPANNLKDVQIKSIDNDPKDDDIRIEEEDRKKDEKRDNSDKVMSDKPNSNTLNAETQKSNLPSSKIDNVNANMPKPSVDYDEEESLLDVMEFANNEWGSDPDVCSNDKKQKYLKTDMHTPNGDVTIYVHDPEEDVHVSASLVEHGEWEGNLIRLINKLLSNDPALKFIDLGANIGVFSLSVAKLHRKVISVEPLSINVKRLCKSVFENEFEDYITIVHNAVSDKHEQVKLGKEKGNVGGTFVNKDKNINKIQGSKLIGEYNDVVNTVKLDDLLILPDFSNFKKVIIKMDVEGFESHVLDGAERFFRKVDVQGVLMEWMWHKTGSDSNKIINFFADHGYEAVNPNGFQVLDIRAPNSWPVDILWQHRTKSSHTHEHEEKNDSNNEVKNQRSEVKFKVKMYNHDMVQWNQDSSKCQSKEQFEYAGLHTTSGDVRIFVHDPNSDVHVSGSLMRDGAWEPHLIRLMYSLLNEDKSLQFIDLGANLGVFSLAVAKYGRKVIAAEPLSINLQRLCKSIEYNHFEDRITVVTNALGDTRENVTFGMDLNNIGGTFVLNDKNKEKQQGSAMGGTYNDRVLTAKVDDFLDIPGFDFKRVIVKMDVEGYEHFVLRGASKFFEMVDVQAVLMEWMWHKAGSGATEIFKFYLDRGYEPFDPIGRVVLNTALSQSWPVDVLWRKKKQVTVKNSNTVNQSKDLAIQNSNVQMYKRDLRQWKKDTSMCIGPANLLKATMHTNVGDVAIFVHDPTDDVWVSGSLLREGSWEPDLIRLVYTLLSQDPNLQFMDLGTNLGAFSLAVAAFGRQVISVEPLSINLNRLCASIVANRFEKVITVVTNPLSDKRENVTFGKDQGNVGGTYVLNDKNENKVSGSAVNGKYDDVVLSAMLDDVMSLPGFNFRKIIMKMDVEGYEHHVLRGAENFFRTVDVQAVLMEWMWQKDGSSSQEIIQFFTKFHYKPFSPANNTPLQPQDSSNWPTDVLWKKENLISDQNMQKKETNIQPNRQKQSEIRTNSQKTQGDKALGSLTTQATQADRQRLVEQTQRTLNMGNNNPLGSSDAVQKNQALDHRNSQLQSRKGYGVNFYRREGENWLADDSSCSAEQQFTKANLHTPAGDVTIFVHNPNDDVHVSGGLIRNEAWEPHLIRLMFDLLRKDQELQFMDLGANLGVFSLAVAQFGRRVFAAEPLSINLQRFCTSIKANHFEEKITVVTNALSDKIENVSFGKDQGNIGGTFVLNDKNVEKYSGSAVGGKYKDVVQTAKLDSFLNLPGFDFTKVIMKIDVEGYESHVFKAADKFFKQVDVQAVLMEWMWHKSGSDSAIILDFFEDRNYEPIDPNTNSRLDVSDYSVWPVDVLWKKSTKPKTKSGSKVSSIFTSGVQVYRHDLRNWQPNDGICLNLPRMTRGEIKNSLAGPFTIYVYEAHVDKYVSGGILRDGGWETHLVNTVLSMLKQDEDLQFVDLGANLGVYALAAAKMGRKVIAVDPLTSNVQRLCHSIQDNDLGSKMTLVYNALSDKRGHVRLGKDDQNVGGTFVVDRGNQNKVQGSNVNGQFSEDVVTSKLDDLLELPGFDFKKIIMKMDVEGYEGFVLKGGQKFFSTVDVQAVFMEWMWLKQGSVTQEVIEFFTSRGYRPYISTSGRELRLEDATTWPVDMMWKKD